MQVRNKIPVSSATLEQLEVAGCGCGFYWYLVCSGGKFGSTDDFHDCSAVASTLDCRCSFFVCHSDLLGDSVPNHCKEKGRTIKILSQLIPIFECKSETKSLFHLPLWNNWKLLVAVAVSAGILVCSDGKFGSTDDFHDCSAVAATLDCCCDFFVCNSDLLGDSVPNHCKEKGRTIKKQPLSFKKDCFPSIYDKLYHKPVILCLLSATVRILPAAMILLVLRTLYLPVSMKCQ